MVEHQTTIQMFGEMTWQRKFLKFLHRKKTQYFLIGLVFLDMLAVISTGIIETIILEEQIEDIKDAVERNASALTVHEIEGFVDHRLEDAEHGLEILSIAILSFFAFEHLVLFVIYTKRWIRKPMLVFDFIVVIVSLLLEIYADQIENMSILIFFRMWRFIRVGKCVEQNGYGMMFVHILLGHGWLELEEELHEIKRIKIEKKERKKKQLEEELRRIQIQEASMECKTTWVI
eukprot:m.83260 g.83260  ORF g.83260 m.83260 type:complete len:232 (+) comp12913_c0_seq2:305-1000(+)